MPFEERGTTHQDHEQHWSQQLEERSPRQRHHNLEDDNLISMFWQELHISSKLTHSDQDGAGGGAHKDIGWIEHTPNDQAEEEIL